MPRKQVTNAADPQTDRELILKFGGQLERLSDTISRLDTTLKDIEETKLKALNDRLISIEKWQNEINGIWKAVIIFSGAASILISLIALLVHK